MLISCAEPLLLRLCRDDVPVWRLSDTRSQTYIRETHCDDLPGHLIVTEDRRSQLATCLREMYHIIEVEEFADFENNIVWQILNGSHLQTMEM
jgi:hypothetical protein